MSGLLTLKMLRDVRASWSRFALMVLAIAVSLTVFGAVLSAWAVMDREATRAYLSTEPASATVVLGEAMAAERMRELATAARQRPGVLEATGRTQFTSDIEVNGRPRDVKVQVFVVSPDDPMRVATFTVQQGTWPPQPNEILVRRDSLALLDVAVGDIVTIATPNRERARLRVAGTVYDPSLAPSPQEQRGGAYLSAASLASAGGQSVLDQLKIQVGGPGETAASRDRDVVVAIAGVVGQWLQEERGLPVREIQVPEPYAHPHQFQADTLLLALLVGGAAAVLLSAILVATMLNGLFARQIPEIGIMKAVGARSGHIGRRYLAMTLAVGATATLLALPPAVMLGAALVEQMFRFLGIEGSRLAAPWWAYAAIVAAGIGLAPLMALIPLVRTSRTTVRAAIDHRGAGAGRGAGRAVLTSLSRVHLLDRGVILAVRNAIRRPARFVLAVGLLASAGTVFVAGMSVSSGVDAIQQESRAQRVWDVDVQLVRATPFERVAAVVEGIPGLGRVEGWDRAPAGIAGPDQIPITRTYPDQGHGRTSLVAVPDGATTLPPPKVIEGRWLEPGETGAVVLNQIARKNALPGVRAGDTVQLLVDGRPTLWRVAGVVEERHGGAGAYATAAGFAAALGRPRATSELRIITERDDERARRTVAEDVTRALRAAGIEVASATSVSRRDVIAEGHFGPLSAIILAIAIAMGLVGGIGLASTMSANVLDRTREFGVMHAIGARPAAVRRIVVAEGLFVAIASCVVAVIPALALTALLRAGLGELLMGAPLPFRISALGVGLWIALVVLGALLATDAAATRASRLTVREALAHL